MEQEALHKSRRLDFKSDILSDLLNQRLKMVYDQFENKILENEDLPIYINELYDEDFLIQYHGLIALRKYLSVAENTPISLAIQFGAIPILVQIIKNQLTPYHIHEACWSLTNIASGTSQETELVVNRGGIKIFIKLVNSDILDIAEQATWALGNIAGDNARFRDMILNAQGHIAIINFAEKCKNIMNSYKQCVWALANLSRGSPGPKFSVVKVAIPSFCCAIQSTLEPETLTDALWALSHLTNNEEGQRQVCEIQTLKRLSQFLGNEQLGILVPALRTLGNIATGDEKMTDYVLECGILIQVPLLLNHHKKVVRKETCWMLSNIAAGFQHQGKQLLYHKEIMELLSKIALEDQEDVRLEAIYTFANLTSQLDINDFQLLMDYRFLEICIKNIPLGSIRILAIIIESTENIIKNVFHKLQKKIPIDILEQWKDGITQLLDKVQAQTVNQDLIDYTNRVQRSRIRFQDNLILYKKKG